LADRLYDRAGRLGRMKGVLRKLDKALDAAALDKWTVVDMKKDWKRVFAFD
jgi:hypothetical protein